MTTNNLFQNEVDDLANKIILELEKLGITDFYITDIQYNYTDCDNILIVENMTWKQTK